MSNYSPRRSMEEEQPYEEESDLEEDDFPRNAGDDKQAIARRVLQDFEDILDAAGNRNPDRPIYNFDRPEDLIKFEERFRGKFETENPTHGTLLHAFVMSRNSPLLLGKWIVKKWPDLIKVQDSEKKTPLHLALDPKYHLLEFVELVLADCADSILAAALAMEDHGGRNCLHHAILQKFRSTLKLIKKCGPETFTAKDKAELQTPLLMAMDFDYPFKRRSQFSRAAPPRVQPPTDRRKSVDVSDRTSVDEIDPKKGANTTKKRIDVQSKNELKDKDMISKAKDGLVKPDDSKNIKATAKDAPRGRPPPNLRRRPDVDSFHTGSASQDRFYLPEVVQSLMNASKKSMSERDPQGRTPYQYRLHLLSTVTGGRAPRGDIVIQDIVAQDMKEFCLRNLGREEAIEMLYEKGKEKHIEFDLSSLPSSSISRADLDQLARHLTFEDTLKYVALPKLHVEDPKRENHAEDSKQNHGQINSTTSISELRGETPPGTDPSKQTQPERFGLSDASIIFKWLWENNVRRIFRVVVIDDGETPHSNQVIEEALVNFKVEIWDWKKIDICSETIYRAAKDVRVVYLYTSGNSAVLRGWSCEVGLVKLEKLQKVNLIIRQGFETERRRDADLADFKKSFLSNWAAKNKLKDAPVVEMISDDKSKSYASWFQNNQGPEEKQQWLIHMDTFASFITPINMEHEQQIREQEREEAKRQGATESERPKQLEDIKVALIDDGIDGFESILSKNIAHGVSFCRPSDSEDLMRTYYVSSGGHGTMMARLIRRMCPKVKFYVARLEEYKSSSGKRFITARSARQAVDWAVTNGVHIISMSWTIESTESDHDIQELKKSIDAAKAAKISMFCAFSDQGNNAPENTFPGYWKNECWTIGAATSRGDASTLVDKNRVDFLFPGEQIVVDPEASQTAAAPARGENGSSISTALAAGTAALLLFITQLVEPAFYTKLREPDRLKKALEQLCSKDNPKYFAAQNFNLKFADPEWNWDNDGRKQVGILVESFMSKDERSSG